MRRQKGTVRALPLWRFFCVRVGSRRWAETADSPGSQGLFLNAIQAMRDVGEEERELLISTRNEPDRVSVEVRDSGPGFAPGALERVFEPFYTTKPDGMGLGLSICRSIIEAHGGRLWAIPYKPRGALFQFTIPATCADVA
jgi:signal transduction histidine kinase